MALRSNLIPVPPGRLQYRRSSGVNLPLFVVGAAGVCLVALAMGWVLWFMEYDFVHIVFCATALAAIPPMGALCWVVVKSCCRNIVVICLAALLAGTLMHVGQYYFGMVHAAWNEQDDDVTASIDQLPQWIHATMQNQKLAHSKWPDLRPERPQGVIDLVGHYLVFGAEYLLAVGIIAAGPFYLSTVAFDERNGRWMYEFGLLAAGGSSQILADCLISGQTANLVLEVIDPPAPEGVPFCQIVIEASKEPYVVPPVIYPDTIWISAREFRPTPDEVKWQTESRIKQWELRPNEYAVLRQSCPSLPAIGASRSV